MSGGIDPGARWIVGQSVVVPAAHDIDQWIGATTDRLHQHFGVEEPRQVELGSKVEEPRQRLGPGSRPRIEISLGNRRDLESPAGGAGHIDA